MPWRWVFNSSNIKQELVEAVPVPISHSSGLITRIGRIIYESRTDIRVAGRCKGAFKLSTDEQWAREIELHIHSKVREQRSRTSQTTADVLEALTPVTSSEFGAYACILRLPDKGKPMLYVGSAMDVGGGLKRCKDTHLETMVYAQNNPSPVLKLIRQGYTPTFVTLMQLDGTQAHSDIVVRTHRRILPLLTEAGFIELWGAWISGRANHFLWRRPEFWVGTNKDHPLKTPWGMNAALTEELLRVRHLRKSASETNLAARSKTAPKGIGEITSVVQQIMRGFTLDVPVM